GLSLLADRARRELGFDDAQANDLEIVEGVVSGEVIVRVTHGRKDRAVRSFCKRFGLSPGEVIAVGDTDGDISMFEAAGYAIAFPPLGEEVVRRADACVRGEALEDLAAALPITRAARPARPGTGRRGLSARDR